MHSLFELTRLLSVCQTTKGDVKPKTTITKFAWKEEGEVSLLALACSNDQILLRYSITGKLPQVKQMPWISGKTIVSMCFDPTVVWLLILTHIPDIYLIPAFGLMEPKARINQLWNIDDATHITLERPKGDVTVICWWHTLDDQQIAIIGTKAGELIFVNLLRKRTVASTKIEETILKLDLVIDDQQMTTSLLITAAGNNQWKLLLESRNLVREYDPNLEGMEPFPEFVKTIMVQTDENKEMFLPLRYGKFQRSVSLSPQNARGRHFVTAHEDKTATFQVYDSHVEHSPLFIYKLPVGAYNIILSDRLIFANTRVGAKKLLIISNQRAEISLEDHQDFNKESILQQFELPQNESLLGMVKKCFPFYWHEKHEHRRRSGRDSLILTEGYGMMGGVQAIPLGAHTVLDGCILVTNMAVYECRPRVSPERLFLDLAIRYTDATHAETLGISVGLDLTSLFELAADYLLRVGEYARSVRLYQLSKCSHIKRVGNLARHGRLVEVTGLLRQVLNSHQVELSTAERKELADMALHCCVYTIAQEKDVSSGISEAFREFLFGSFSFDETKALLLLSDFSLFELLFEFAKARGLVVEALELLVLRSQFLIPHHLLVDLVTRGFSNHLVQAGKGALLHCLSPDDLVRLLLTKPQLAIHHVELLNHQLHLLDEDLLLHLAATFDPSKPVMKSILNKCQSSSRTRTTSISSLSSLTSEMLEMMGDPSTYNPSHLVEFFLNVVLTINRKRGLDSLNFELSDLLGDLDAELEDLREKEQPVMKPYRKLAFQPSFVGCGSQHCALVRNGDLFIWGLTNKGRLGHGDLVTENSVATPSRVETLHMLQIRVLSVSCGGEHTIVITQQGVYGWGSSAYGQVGVGTRHHYTRPMLIESLQTETVISVDCGQYHTLALTEDSNVYSWGWGVHGQLGHGDPEDQLQPKLVECLQGKEVVRIAAGYCHSLFLNDKGSVYTCGCGYFGQLGHGDNQKKSIPTRVSLLPEPVTAIATKFFHTVVVTTSSRVFSWGCHPHSLRYSAQLMRRARQLGQHLSDPVESYLSPNLVDTTYVSGKIIHVTCGSLHSVILNCDGEMFVWGRNMDGQLGTGVKQDERIPKMLTKINDHHFLTVKSGGEFNIAMDTENGVWVWGKNDTGQLGILVVDLTPSHSRPRRGGGGNSSSEIINPTLLKGLPGQDAASLFSWQQSLMQSSESGDSEYWVTEDLPEDHHLSMMPSLEKVGKVKYCRKVIPTVLKYLPHLTQQSTVLRLCMDNKDWLSAADIYLLSDTYSQALLCQLQLLTERRSSMSPAHFHHYSLQVIQHYIRCTLSEDHSPSELRDELHIIVVEVLEYWETNELSVIDLEAVFLNHLSLLAGPLSIFMFRSHSADSKQSSSSGKLFGPSDAFLQKFSTDFCLRLLHSLLSSSSGDPNVMFKDWMYALEDTSGGDNSVISDSRSKPKVEMQPSNKLIPYERLWQDIIQNLQKHSDSRSHISLTRNEMDHLEVQLEDVTSWKTTQGLDESPERRPNESGAAVLFTCGHHFTRNTFTQEVLHGFERELTEGPGKLPYSASVLKQYYNRQGLLPLACPKCVLNALMTIT